MISTLKQIKLADVRARIAAVLNTPKRIAVASIVGLWLVTSVLSSLFSSGVVVAHARRGDMIKAVSGTITVRAEIETQLLSSGNGFLLETSLSEGKVCKKGDVLARIDAQNLPFQIQAVKIELETIEREIASGTANDLALKNLERDLALSKEMLKRGFISQADYDASASKFSNVQHGVNTERNTIDARYKIKRNELAGLQDALNRLTIVAPMDGTITQVHSAPGDLLSIGKPLANIISSGVKISAEVNQDDIEVLKAGGDAVVRFFAYPNQKFEAKVRQILPSSTADTQRFTIYLDLVQRPENLLPGMTGEASFTASKHKDTLIIPRQALMGDYVFVMKGSYVTRHKVKTGYLSYSDAEVVEGLKEGDCVVAEDTDLCRDGQRASIKRVAKKK